MFASIFSVVLALAVLVAGEAKTPGIYPLRPWTRTAPDGVISTVTPLLVEGVTLSPRPPAVTATSPLPWISLKKNGAPVTIRPKVKKEGWVEKPSPSYGTWFAYETDPAVADPPSTDAAAAVAVAKKQNTVLNNRYFKGEFERLNPVIRCTPERYVLNGDYEPFCSPDLHTELQSGHAYFVTWYPGYFNSSRVRINLLDYDVLSVSGGNRPDISPEDEPVLKSYAFHTTEWIDNELGYYFLEIQRDWIGKGFSKSVYITLETPEQIGDDIDVQHVPLVSFLKGPKATRADKDRYENAGWDVILAVPLSVLGFAVFLAIFHFCTRRARRIGNISIGGHRSQRTRKRRNQTYEKLQDVESGSSITVG
ncbi:uncharacterized protein V1516DRAFT_644832 [Lipomyces oligophaga]|uniref:uncharacterized protein n=1 Tax=Lipomyces oligophaga TaxID=45792 RepID=UPI0034CE3CBD